MWPYLKLTIAIFKTSYITFSIKLVSVLVFLTCRPFGMEALCLASVIPVFYIFMNGDPLTYHCTLVNFLSENFAK